MGACLSRYKDIMILFYHDIILASRNETFKQIAAREYIFIIVFYFLTFHASRKHLNTKFRIHAKKKGLITPSRHVPLYFIMPIILLFHESRPEKGANHTVTPCTQERTNNAITPTAGSAS